MTRGGVRQLLDSYCDRHETTLYHLARAGALLARLVLPALAALFTPRRHP